MKKTAIIIFLFSLFFSFRVYADQGDYKNYTRLINSFKQLTNAKDISIASIGESDSGKKLYVFKIGNDKLPAVFIGANISGFDMASSESSLNLAKYIIEKIKDKDKNYTNKCFYIIPVLNPDLYSVYFKKPLEYRVKNYTPKDDDGDGLIDEDPPEDLNKDGYITIMRVKAVDGKYIEDKGFPCKLKKANPVKGERGIYKFYIEGIDNDGDGKYNEDPKGGVIINNNFPVLFKYNKKSSGLYPVSEKTTKTILDFILNHKNILLAYIIDRTNNMIKLPELGRTSKLGDTKVKIPKGFGKFLGLDTTKKYALKELVKILKELGIGRGMNLTEEMVASFLGVVPPASVDAHDYKYYKQLSKEYKKLAKKDKVNIKRVVKGEKDGSLIKWFYFNTGILSIGVDIWSLPKAVNIKKKTGLTLEKLKKMSSEEFLKIDDKVLEQFFKKMNVPQSFNIQIVKNMVKSGRITPEKMAGSMEKYSSKASEKGESKNQNLKNYMEKELNGEGAIKWKEFNHPQLGKVEIGGIIPFVETIPRYDKLKKNEKLIEDFFNLLVAKTPEIKIEGIKIIKQKTGVYKVKFYIVNEGYLPFYLNMGKRNKYSMPILVKLELPKDSILIEGKKINRISDIGGIGSAREINYLILSGKNRKIKIKVHHKKITDIVRTFDLGGVK